MMILIAALQIAIVLVGSASASRWNCTSMMPDSETVGEEEPQAFAMPFTISTDEDEYHEGDTINVYINSTGVPKIRGFLIQARRGDPALKDTHIVGRFERQQETKPTCYATWGSGLEGYGESLKGYWPRDHLVFQWTAPAQVQGHIRFWVSVISDSTTKAEYWVAETSSILLQSGKAPYKTTTPKSLESLQLSTISVDECGKAKSCYRNPPACEHNCDQIITWKDRGDVIHFELSGVTQGWVAVGFSDDKKMGHDDVLECVWNERVGSVEVRMSTNRKDGKHNDPISESELGIINVSTMRTDSRVSCSFSRQKSVAVGSTFWEWDDSDREFHILMAKGDVDDEGNKLRHDLEAMKYPFVSKQKERLSVTVDIDGNARYWLVKMHGCLMIIAWMMCCTTAILLAKYYKPMWPNDELCGTDVWFAVHRGVQCVTLGCTVLGFILIFIHAGGYSHMPELPDKAHPILGIIVTILCIINPLIALCRCSPKSEYRPIYNWIHWFFGTIAAVLSMPTLFIGLNLHKAFVPWWATWVMVAFMLFHLVVELMLEIHGCINSKKQRVRNDEYDIKRKGDHRGDYYRLEPEPVGTRFKKRTLAIYLAVVIICGLIMIISIAVG